MHCLNKKSLTRGDGRRCPAVHHLSCVGHSSNSVPASGTFGVEGEHVRGARAARRAAAPRAGSRHAARRCGARSPARGKKPSGQYIHTNKATNTASGSVCASVGRDPLPPRAPPFVFYSGPRPTVRRGRWSISYSPTATYGAARTVVYILFPILPSGGASKPRRGAVRFSSFAPPVKPCDLFAERPEAAQFSSFGPADGARIFLRRPARHPL